MKAKNNGQVINYLIFIIVAATLGVLARIYGEILPDVIANYGGDAMWAVTLYFVVALLSLKRSFGFRFLLTSLILVLDELSQLYHAPWVDDLRDTSVGALILGNTFDLTDLIFYLAGAVLALIVDYTFVKTR